MSDPLRADPARALEAAPEPGRDAKIEQLLLVGLDHYFDAGGHLRDALAVLDRVSPTDAQRADADRLCAAIQRQLIGLVSAAAEASPDIQQGGGPLP
jgi:erythromycin esterase-like protein